MEGTLQTVYEPNWCHYQHTWLQFVSILTGGLCTEDTVWALYDSNWLMDILYTEEAPWSFCDFCCSQCHQISCIWKTVMSC